MGGLVIGIISNWEHVNTVGVLKLSCGSVGELRCGSVGEVSCGEEREGLSYVAAYELLSLCVLRPGHTMGNDLGEGMVFSVT